MQDRGALRAGLALGVLVEAAVVHLLAMNRAPAFAWLATALSLLTVVWVLIAKSRARE